jgi:hypothetical protein
LKDYLKAQDLINTDKIILQKQVRVKRKSKDHGYIIKRKLHEKIMQIEALTKKQQEIESKFN